MRLPRLAAGAMTALLAATVITVAQPAATSARAAAISCSTSSSGKAASFYAGPSASYAYDNRFSGSVSVPYLGTHTPQGLGVWRNWDGAGHTLLLVTAYRTGARTLVHGIDPATGLRKQSAEIAETHGGGIAVSGNWIFISGAGNSIRKYRTSDMRFAMQHHKTRVYVKQVGTARSVYGASFLSTYNGYLFAGRFNETGRDRMYAYKISGTGALTTQPGSYQVPAKTQGLVVTGTRFIFSTSFGRTNRGNLYVVKRGYSSLDSAALRCFRTPSMIEGIVTYGGLLYAVYESGSYVYRATALNPIYRLHKAGMTSLVNLV